MRPRFTNHLAAKCLNHNGEITLIKGTIYIPHLVSSQLFQSFNALKKAVEECPKSTLDMG